MLRCLRSHGQLSLRLASTLPAALLVLQGAVAAAEGPSATAIPREAVPLPRAAHGCEDSLYPRLTGRFVLFCGPTGKPDRVLDLRTGEEVRLEHAADSWALLEGRLYALGRDQGAWTLPEDAPRGPGARGEDALTPPAWDGRHVAYGSDRGLVIFEVDHGVRRILEASPAPWQPPALGWEQVVWTEVHEGDADLWAAGTERGRPELLVGGPGLQHHPVGTDQALAWIDRGDVVVWTPEGQRRLPADAGFDSPPALWGDHVCWGDRGQGALVVRCEDGWSAPGRRPSGGGPLLLVHTPAGPVLYRARWWPVRVEQGAVRVSDWWGTGAVRIGEETLRVEAGQEIEVAVDPGLTEVRVLPAEVSP